MGDAGGGTEPGRRRSDERGETEFDGGGGGSCLVPWLVGLRRGCFLSWSLRRAGVAHFSRRILVRYLFEIEISILILFNNLYNPNTQFVSIPKYTI